MRKLMLLSTALTSLVLAGYALAESDAQIKAKMGLRISQFYL